MGIHWHCMGCSGAGFDVCQECNDKAITCGNAGHILKKRYCSLNIIIEAAAEDLRTYIIQRIADAPSLHQCVSKKVGLQEEILGKVTKFAKGM